MADGSGVSWRLFGSMPLASPSSMFSVSPVAWRECTRANYFGTHCEIILKCTRNRAHSNFGNNVLRTIKSLPTSLVDSADHPKGQFLVHIPFLRSESRLMQPACSINCLTFKLRHLFPGFQKILWEIHANRCTLFSKAHSSFPYHYNASI